MQTAYFGFKNFPIDVCGNFIGNSSTPGCIKIRNGIKNFNSSGHLGLLFLMMNQLTVYFFLDISN